MNTRTLLIILLAIVTVPIMKAQQSDHPPGVIVDYIPQSTGKHIGSPAICILPNGDYVATHDEFGPKSTEYRSAITHVFASSDKGLTWEKISTIDGQFWSNLFYHNNALYIMGTNKHHGNIIIRKSIDFGATWTIPYDAQNGLILEGEYHTAPVPVLIHNGRIWRAVEYATAKSTEWGERYSAAMLSIPVDDDLMIATNWTRSNHLPYDSAYVDGHFKAWLEGNAVATKDGKIVNILRVETPNLMDEYCAIVNVDENGKSLRFNPENFLEMPGAAKKFTIRYDKETDKYWTIVNAVSDDYKGKSRAATLRNRASLASSVDLKKWKIEKELLFHPDNVKHAFQYIDWQFDGNDIIYVSRTAYDDNKGGAKSAHDANYLTFHRITDFRNK